MNKINFHLTNACNFECKHCFGKFDGKEMLSLEKACSVVDNICRYFKQKGIKNGEINLAGGEPLLYPHLDELIDYIYACGIKVSIVTNGSLLTKEKVALWKDKVYCLGLSVDSFNYETNIKIGRCHCKKVLKLRDLISITQAIHRNGIKLKINTVVSKLNVNEDMREGFKRLKPDRLKFLQLTIVDGINDEVKSLKIGAKQFKNFCKKHQYLCKDAVSERSDDMENSYVMINPQGEVQLNDEGNYQIYGSCLEKEFVDIAKTLPIDNEKFDKRYTNNKPICIFGGHETWINDMKKRLPNARIIKNDKGNIADIIRNQDEIWIQNNAISHPFYWKVISCAKNNKTLIFYFKYASVQKCIEQYFSESKKQTMYNIKL